MTGIGGPTQAPVVLIPQLALAFEGAAPEPPPQVLPCRECRGRLTADGQPCTRCSTQEGQDQ